MKWAVVKLQRVTSKVGSGATPRGGEAVYQPSGIPLIRSMNVHFNGFRTDGLVYINEAEAALLDHVVVQENDVLFNITGASIGRVTTAPGALAGARVNQHVCILRPTQLLLPRFLSYYLSTPQQQAVIDNNQNGGTRQAITKAMLLNWDVPLPAVREQSRIVEILELADALRQKRAGADALADRILPALFHKLFGDPTTNPKKWPVVKIGQITSLVTSGVTPRGGSENYVPSGPYFLRSQNIRMNCLDLSAVACLPAEVHEEMSRTKVQPGDVLLNITGASIGRVAWYDVPHHEANVNQHVCIMRLKDDASPEFVSYFLSSPHGQSLILGAQTGATRQGLNHENVRRIPVPLPSRQTQHYFAQLVRDTRRVERQRATAGENLNNTYNLMLHRAFTGDLTAKWREAHMKELLAEMEQQAKLLKQSGGKL